MSAKSKSPKYVYFFGGGKADGKTVMKNLLGGKGANLAEMAGHPKLKLPVPPGFTITTEVCTYYYKHKKSYPSILMKQVNDALKKVEKIMKSLDKGKKLMLYHGKDGFVAGITYQDSVFYEMSCISDSFEECVDMLYAKVGK